MGLRDIESTLPPGFRFYPSDEELVCHYLRNKVVNERFAGEGMVEVDLHIHEPWELPDVAKLSTNEWYFFSFRDRKYATGLRTNRATKSGYWKATGKDRTIRNPKGRAIVGMRKTLVFYRGRAPNGMKTSWVMHEFRMENPHTPPKEDWVLCRVFYKKKADHSVDYFMETEQEIRSGVQGSDPSSHDPLQNHSTSPLPDGHHGGAGAGQICSPNYNDFSNMALLHCNIFDFQPLLENSNAGVLGTIAPGSRVHEGDCGLLLDLGLEEQYDSIMEM